MHAYSSYYFHTLFHLVNVSYKLCLKDLVVVVNYWKQRKDFGFKEINITIGLYCLK